MSLNNIILDTIRKNGPITVADYMNLALAHPEHGYYMRRDPFGVKGDFITAPETSQVFGELIGAWAATLWQQMDGGDVLLVELGPGRGTLMQDMLRATRHLPDFHDSLCVTMIETSPALRRLQEAALLEAHSRISWQTTLEDLPELPMIVIANEFFDALPIRQYVKTPEGLQEKLVDIDPEDEEKLCFIIQEMGIRLVKGGKYSGDEEIVESSPATRSAMSQIGQHIAEFGGGGLVIDYGYTGGSRGNTLQAVKSHGFHPVLETPGEADLTAHVDFDALSDTIHECGLIPYGPVEQGTLLQRLGIEIRTEVLLSHAPDKQDEIISAINRLVSPSEMGELFKALSFVANDDIVPAGFVS